MKLASILALAGSTITVLTLFSTSYLQDPELLDGPKLKSMLVSAGYELNELNGEVGKEKYEFLLTASDLDIPVAAEISGSTNYVWLTVFLGPGPSEDSAKNSAFLKKNFVHQPCVFYVTTKGNLMMGLALDNRAVTSAILQRNVKKIVADVASTKDLWLAPD